jgi:hypothetical protein
MKYKDQATENSNYYKEMVLEKGKNHKVTQYTEKQLESVVSYLEN